MTGGGPPPPGRMPGNFIVFGPRANCTLDLCPVEMSVYGYRPSLAANGAFIALFTIAAMIHAYLGIRWRSWWFMGCMVTGCFVITLGYIGRIILYYNPWSFAGFMMQISMSCSSLSPIPPFLQHLPAGCSACVACLASALGYNPQDHKY